MRSWLMAMLMLTAVLAGCADDPAAADDAGDDTDGQDTQDGQDGTNQTGGDLPVAANNTAPVANLTADVLNGTAPLLVNLSLSGTDADGDNLTWVLANATATIVNGSALPATLNFTLAAGNHTFLLTVSDGNASATANLTIQVVAGDEIPAGPCGGEPEPCIIAEHPWVTVWSDGRCDAKGVVGNAAAGWIHDRPGADVPVVGGSPAGGDWPQGTGYISGGGTWIYEETNGIGGLQLNDNVSPLDSTLGTDGFAVGLGCTGGDTMLF